MRGDLSAVSQYDHRIKIDSSVIESVGKKIICAGYGIVIPSHILFIRLFFPEKTVNNTTDPCTVPIQGDPSSNIFVENFG
jgi:hypothetical protein